MRTPARASSRNATFAIVGDRLGRERARGAVHLPAPGPERVRRSRGGHDPALRCPAHRALEGVRVRGRERRETQCPPVAGEADQAHCRICARAALVTKKYRGHRRYHVARRTGPPSFGSTFCPNLPHEPQQRTGPRRVLADVVLAGQPDERVNDAEVAIAHRDAASVVVVRVLAQVPRLEATNAQGEIRAPARPRRAVGDDAEEAHAPLAPLVRGPREHHRVVLARPGDGGFLIAPRRVLRRVSVSSPRRAPGRRQREREREGHCERALHPARREPETLAPCKQDRRRFRRLRPGASCAGREGRAPRRRARGEPARPPRRCPPTRASRRATPL